MTSTDGRAFSSARFSSVTVPIPDNTSLVIVNGTRGPDEGLLLVRISPSPPNWTAAGVSLNLSMAIQCHDQPLVYAVLDPTVQYSMALTRNDDSRGSTGVQLRSLTYYSALW